MQAGIGSNTWSTVDSWWDTWVDSQSGIQTTRTTRTLDDRWLTGLWEEVDPWWDTEVDTRSLTQIDRKTGILDERRTNGMWDSIAPWWETYSEVRRAEVSELTDLLEDLEEIWRRSNSRFEEDPLTANWTEQRHTRGPLRPNQEENWSQWLAHLLRASSGEFTRELFGNVFPDPPVAVEREVHLPDTDAPDRYADILLFYADRGISIEVKKGDEHYQKTTHPAGLVEDQYDRNWTHILLVPKYKTSTLHQTFEDSIDEREGDRLMVRSEQSDSILVLYWQDISKVIRNTLCSDVKLNPHWEASAYLFCTLIEQTILGFTPHPLAEQVASADEMVQMSSSLAVAQDGIDEQVSYLQTIMEEHHE